jgi:HAD superfamily hydrolase (TIGR01490 family)
MKLAIFDFDGTLLTRDTLPCLGIAWRDQKLSYPRFVSAYMAIIPFVLMYRLNILSRENMKEKAVTRFHHLFTGMNRESIDFFFQTAYPVLNRYFNPAILNEIEKAQVEGFQTVLLSGSYASLLKVVAANLGIDHVIGVELPYKEDVFDHKQIIPCFNGQVKLMRLQQFFDGQDVDWQASRSYCDSYDDLPVMELVGDPVAVNAEPKLSCHAERNGWRKL